MSIVLQASNVCSGYDKSPMLHDVSFTLKEKEKLALIGRNGVGKTTLLKCIMGINKLDAGSIVYFDKEKPRSSTYEISRGGVAYVPQGRDIFPDFTVKENLDFGAVNFKKEVVEANRERVLAYFPALKVHLKRKGGLLSGGLQQQLAIARALMSNPKILLLDEPTEGIQPNIVAEIAVILNRVHEELNLPLIIVEQNLKFAFRIANRFMVMQKGQVVVQGIPKEMDQGIIDKYLKV
jgi:urea transport system ATP-binding protein